MIQLVTAPDIPIQLSEAKDHLRVIGNDEDLYIYQLIDTATEEIQQATKRQLSIATYDLFLDAFPAEITVPLPPLVSVDSIKYVDPDGVEQTLDPAEYTVDTVGGRVVPAYGKSWPATRDVPNAVIVRFTCGYPNLIPAPLRSALLLLIGDLYENREAQSDRALRENKAVERLIWPYKVFQ